MQRIVFIILALWVVHLYPTGISVAVEGKGTGDIIDRCRECRLSLTNGEDVGGRLITLNGNSLEIEIHEIPRNKPFQLRTRQQTIPFEEILTLQCGDRASDGAIWRLVVGGFSGFILATTAVSVGREPPYEYDTSVGKMGAIGFLVGGGVGAILGYLIDDASGYNIETINIHEWLKEGSE